MKKVLIAVMSSVLSILAAKDIIPVLSYDFTSSVIQQDGKYRVPVLPNGTKMAGAQKAMLFTGKEYLIIPESANFSLENGATLYALVKFDKCPQKEEDFDMIFFKPNEFLFGRSHEWFYVNLGNKVEDAQKIKWTAPSYGKTIPLEKWTVMTAVFQKVIPDTCIISLYIDGKITFYKKYKHTFQKPNNEPITIGKGWGRSWFLNGQLGKVMIFDHPLSSKQISAMVDSEIYLKDK